VRLSQINLYQTYFAHASVNHNSNASNFSGTKDGEIHMVNEVIGSCQKKEIIYAKHNSQMRVVDNMLQPFPNS
jgi:hypothetical protein